MSSKFTHKRKPSLSIDNVLSLSENPHDFDFQLSSLSPIYTYSQTDSDNERSIGNNIDNLGMSRKEVKRLTQSIENQGIDPTFIAQQLLQKKLIKNENLRNYRNKQMENMTDEEKRAHKEKRRLDRIRYRLSKTKEQLEREYELARKRKQKFLDNKRKKSGGKQTRKQTNKYKKRTNMRKSKKVYK